MPDLKEKVAVITGASMGIGEGTALHFASLGCSLALMSRNEAALEKVAEACCANGLARDKVIIIPGDVSVEEDVAAAVDKAANHFGKIDILVNNAAVIATGDTECLPLEVFDKIWTTNLRGPLCMIRKALPYLRETKGSIVNVSSIASTTIVSGSTFYSMAKAALDNLTRCIAFENGPYGVRVNAVNPAVIKTTMGKLSDVSDHEHVQLLEKMTSGGHALRRVGTPEEVARCIAFLASHDASFVTGVTMPVDGGMRLMSSLAAPNPWHRAQTSA